MSSTRSSGVELSRAYFEEVVRPIIEAAFSGMPYAAGRLGTGSDVLGLDDPTSRDHDWGLRLSIFVPEDRIDAVDAELTASLPSTFRDLPTRFAFTGGTVAQHRVEVDSARGFLAARIGFDPRSAPSVRDWLSLCGQSVLEVTAGPIFADQTGEITAARAALAWYPDDIWRYVLAADWKRLDRELPLMSRAGDVGDEQGARIIAARLAQATMHLAFTLERTWAPYSKWFGTKFRDLRAASQLGPSIDRLLHAETWQPRQDALAEALRLLLEQQNILGLTTTDRATAPFWDRPYLRIDPTVITQLLAGIRDPHVRALSHGLGSAEQRTDIVDILVNVAARRCIVTD